MPQKHSRSTKPATSFSLRTNLLFSGGLITLIIGATLYHHFAYSSRTSFLQHPKICLSEICHNYLPIPTDMFAYDFLEEVKQITEIGKSNAKPEILALLKELQATGLVLRTGKDAEVRPPFVGAQAEIERTLAYFFQKHEIVHLVGVIHTPTPATPLCTKGEIMPSPVDRSMEEDLKRLYTVQERPSVIRDYLEKGAVLYVTYPQGGREKRTPEQLQIYDAARAKYAHSLVDHVLNCSKIEPDMIGATYLFKTIKGGWLAFSIMSTQANAPQDDIQWGVWFGSLNHPQVRERTEAVLNYLSAVGGPEIASQIFN